MSLVMERILQHTVSVLNYTLQLGPPHVQVVTMCRKTCRNLQAGILLLRSTCSLSTAYCRMASCSLEMKFAVTGFQLGNEKIYVLLRSTLQAPKHEAVEVGVGTKNCVARVQ